MSALRRELALIRNSPYTTDDEPNVELTHNSEISICFDVATEELIVPTISQIQDIESICLSYSHVNDVGKSAPRVLSTRKDFPRDIGHINPTARTEPVSICLARAGLQPIYERFGIAGVLDRLNSWLRDAKSNQLMLDSWEPVPIGEGQALSVGFFNYGAIQELACDDQRDQCMYLGVANQFCIDELNCVGILPPVLTKNDEEQIRAAKFKIANLPKNELTKCHIPYIILTSSKAAPIADMTFGVWNNYGEVCSDLEKPAILPNLSINIVEALHLLVGEGNRPIVVIAGVWRPVPIAETIFGMSKNREARCLELRSFLVRCESSKDPIDKSLKIELLRLNHLPTADMLSFTSGVSISRPIAMLGYGALGSNIVELLLRAGARDLYAIDNDRFETHNISRHGCSVDDVFKFKITHLKELPSEIARDSEEIRITASDLDARLLSEDYLTELISHDGILVDATADAQVRRHLSELTPGLNITVMRAELYDTGKLGVVYVLSKSDTRNLTDLYYELCSLAMENGAVSEWLNNEAVAGLTSEELLFGLGCSSPSPKLPKYLVSQHASVFTPMLIDSEYSKLHTGIGINPLTDSGQPMGWMWFPMVEKPLIHSCDEGWTVKISHSIISNLDRSRVKSGRVETGGYLYGGIDFILKQIYVTLSSDLPPRSKQSKTSLELGPAGKTVLEKRIRWKTGGRVGLVGTWHSHPSSGPQASDKDLVTMQKFRATDLEKGYPTLLLITSPHGIGVHLWVQADH